MRLGQTSLLTFLSRLGSSVLGFVATVYFAKVLGSEVLGIYFLTLATVAWLKLATSIGVPVAITKRVSEQTEKDAYAVAGLLLMSGGLIVVTILIYVFREQVNQYLGEPLYAFVMFLLFAEVAYSFVGAVIRGERLVHVQGILGFIQTVIRVVTQVVAVIVGFKISGLLFGEVVAFILVTVGGAVLLVTYFDRSVPAVKPRRDHFWSIFDFAKYSWLGRLKGRSFNMMDTIVLGFFVPSGLIGIYVVCWNISSVLDIFAKSVSSAFFPEMSKLSSDDQNQQVAKYLRDSLAFAGLFIIPGFVGAVVVGEGVLNLYGGEFRRGYTILVILVAAKLLHSYQKQFVSTMDAVNRPDLSFQVNAFFVATNISMNVVLVYLYGWIGAAVATFSSVLLSLVFAYIMIRSLLTFAVPYAEVATQLVAALVMGGAVYLLELIMLSAGINILRFVPVFTAVGFGAATYFCCLFVLSTRFRTTVADNLPVNVPFESG